MPPCHFFGKEPNLLTSDLPQTHSSFPLRETTPSLWTYDLSSAYQQALYSFALLYFYSQQWPRRVWVIKDYYSVGGVN